MRAEGLCSDTLLSTLISCACGCRQECLWRRLMHLVNRTVMAYPWHELSVLQRLKFPFHLLADRALYGVEFPLEVVTIFSSACCMCVARIFFSFILLERVV